MRKRQKYYNTTIVTSSIPDVVEVVIVVVGRIKQYQKPTGEEQAMLSFRWKRSRWAMSKEYKYYLGDK